MRSVENESLCMYIVILLCIVYKTLTIFVFFFFNLEKKKKNIWPCGILTRGHFATYIGTSGHMAACKRYTWRTLATWISDTWPNCHMSSSCILPCCRYDTWLYGHVATVTEWRIPTFFVVIQHTIPFDLLLPLNSPKLWQTDVYVWPGIISRSPYDCYVPEYVGQHMIHDSLLNSVA